MFVYACCMASLIFYVTFTTIEIGALVHYDKSFPCILLGMSDESKAYNLFDPKTKRIVISKDVMFEEEKSWNWGPNYKEQIEAELV